LRFLLSPGEAVKPAVGAPGYGKKIEAKNNF
jgi:hypothetical protein